MRLYAVGRSVRCTSLKGFGRKRSFLKAKRSKHAPNVVSVVSTIRRFSFTIPQRLADKKTRAVARTNHVWLL